MTSPTTTRSSDTRSPDGDRRRAAAGRSGCVSAALLLFVACAATPDEYFRLSPEAPAHKAAQTRFFETRDAAELLSASAAVLQDLGFHVEESVRELGFLRATKERSARESSQQWVRVLVLIATFGHVLLPIDLQQQIAATLVAAPVGDGGKRHELRIMFHRVVWQGDGAAGREYVPPGIQSTQMIRDPLVYQQFFAKLSKAVFLEAFTL